MALQQKTSQYPINLSKAIHLCIDMQVGYCDPSHPQAQENPQAVAKNAQLVPKINEFAQKARKIHLTNTWMVHALPKILCPPQDIDWQISSRGRKKWIRNSLFGVEAAKNETIIPKGDADGFHKTNLERFLRDHSKDTILLSGLYAHECITGTGLSGKKLGFNVYALTDLIGYPASLGEKPESYFLESQKTTGIVPIKSKAIFSDAQTYESC